MRDISLSLSVLSTETFKPAKSNIAAKFVVSIFVPSFKSPFVA